MSPRVDSIGRRLKPRLEDQALVNDVLHDGLVIEGGLFFSERISQDLIRLLHLLNVELLSLVHALNPLEDKEYDCGALTIEFVQEP